MAIQAGIPWILVRALPWLVHPVLSHLSGFHSCKYLNTRPSTCILRFSVYLWVQDQVGMPCLKAPSSGGIPGGFGWGGGDRQEPGGLELPRARHGHPSRREGGAQGQGMWLCQSLLTLKCITRGASIIFL